MEMKAWTVRRYGGPEALTLESVALPALGRRDVRIRARATTVSSGDSRVRALRLPPGFGPIGRLALGLRGPRRPILGTEVAGTVEAVGPDVTTFRPGDPVVAFTDMAMGCHAEYVTIAEDGLIVAKPPGLCFDKAAALCFGGMTALDFLRRANLRDGERILVIGASGTVGGAFVQLARARGAHVTAVTSTANTELVEGLGAHRVIDYTASDFLTSGQCWDVIADTVAASSFKRCLPVLDDGGRYLAIAGGLGDMLAGRKGTKRSIAGPCRSRLEDLRELSRLAEAGAYVPAIDSVFDFSDIRAAHARTDSARKRGSVVVRFAPA